MVYFWGFIVANIIGLASGILITRTGGDAPYAYIIDDTSSAAFMAYSLRQLSSTYSGFAVEVTRDSDSTSQDIGFVDNQLDTASIESFCSGTTGRVSIWYDQSGNSRDAVQGTLADMPIVYTGGAIVTSSSKPSVLYNTNSMVLAYGHGGGNISTDFSTQMVASPTGASTTGHLIEGYNGGYWSIRQENSDLGYYGPSGSDTGSYVLSSGTAFIAQYDLLTDLEDFAYVNDSFDASLANGDAGLRSINIGSNAFSFLSFAGKISEVIVWNFLSIDDRGATFENINNFYGVY